MAFCELSPQSFKIRLQLFSFFYDSTVGLLTSPLAKAAKWSVVILLKTSSTCPPVEVPVEHSDVHVYMLESPPPTGPACSTSTPGAASMVKEGGPARWAGDYNKGVWDLTFDTVPGWPRLTGDPYHLPLSTSGLSLSPHPVSTPPGAERIITYLWTTTRQFSTTCPCEKVRHFKSFLSISLALEQARYYI